MDVLDKIQSELKIEPMEEPFEYVRKIQAEFDYSKIRFTEEYYDVLGLEVPEKFKISKKAAEFSAAFFKMKFCIKNASFLNFLQNLKEKTGFSVASIDFCRKDW